MAFRAEVDCFENILVHGRHQAGDDVFYLFFQKQQKWTGLKAAIPSFGNLL